MNVINLTAVLLDSLVRRSKKLVIAGGAGQPEYMGTAAISDGDYVHVAINHADLIIMVGHDVVEKPPFFMHPKDTRKVLSSPFPNPVT